MNTNKRRELADANERRAEVKAVEEFVLPWIFRPLGEWMSGPLTNTAT